LLHLIERQELDISAVSLAQVTGQYLEYLSRMEELEAGVLADFLVVAARLILIKSRYLLPRPESPEDEEEEEDPGEALARQLREYKQFKAVAQQLGERERCGLRAYVRVASAPPVERRLDLGGVTLEDLLMAMQQVLTEKPTAPVEEMIQPLVVTVHDKIVLTGELLRRRGTIRFRDLLERATHRVEVVVTLLAVLELIKRGRVIVEQPRLFGEILIRPVPGVDWASFADVSTNGADSE